MTITEAVDPARAATFDQAAVTAFKADKIHDRAHPTSY
jgi:hypothetical protein